MSTMTVSAGVGYGRRTDSRGRAMEPAGTGDGGRSSGRRRPSVARSRAVGRCTTRSQPTAQGLRLTRRGRLLLSAAVLVVLVVAAVLLAAGPSATAGTDRVSPATADRVTVQPGETLWAIAERVAPGTDPRDTVQAILDLNGLRTAQVQAGTALIVPGR